jgi:HlyD family secretion protein
MKLLKLPFVRRETSPDQLIRIFQSETAEIRESPGPVRAHLAVLLLAAMLASLVIVAIVYPIDRVVTSVFGQLVTTDPTIVLQALDPAIIKSIDVREGDRVKTGQLLATLDPTFASADVNALRLQISSLNAEIARCEAELAGQPFNFEPDNEPGSKLYAALQQSYYDQRKTQYDSQLKAYDELIAQNEATIRRLQADLAAYGERGKVNKEIEGIRASLATHEWGSRLLLLQQTDLTLEVARFEEADRNSLVETEHQLEATTSTRAAFIQQWQAQTSQELINARNQRDAAKQQLDKATKHQELVSLQAPEDSIVLSLAVLSVGSVLQQGQSLVQLAPLRSPVEAEVYVLPLDVGFIRVGDETTIKLDPYHFVEHGWLVGKVEWISAGTFTASQITTGGNIPGTGSSPAGGPVIGAGGATGTGQAGSLMQVNTPFYKVRISITRVELRNVPADFRVLPGTTLSADIHVGTRSVFWYLVRGIVKGYDESMREP